MLTTVPYSEIAGQLGVELDSMFTCGKFLKKWTKRPEILTSISRHHETGQPLSEELANKIIQGMIFIDVL